MVPSNASAAMATVSDRVGWGWMVSPMSAASAPVSMARAASAMRSPALGPTIPAPMTRSVVSSNRTLVRPSSRPEGQGAAGRGPGEHALAVLDPGGFGLVLGDPDPGDLGVGVGDAGDDGGVEVAGVPGGVLGGDLALVGGLVREHRLADDVADGEDVRRRWCAAACRPGRTRARRRTPRRRRPRSPCRSGGGRPRRAPCRTPRSRGPCPARSNETVSPSGPAWTAVTLVETRLVVGLGDPLGQRGDQVLVRAGDELVHQLDHRDPGAQLGVDGGHLQADDPAAEHQQPSRGCRPGPARRWSRSPAGRRAGRTAAPPAPSRRR